MTLLSLVVVLLCPAMIFYNRYTYTRPPNQSCYLAEVLLHFASFRQFVDHHQTVVAQRFLSGPLLLARTE